MPTIQKLTALEILDSRGRPTVQATCTLASGAIATVSVPSGASTGAAEALELRDRDPKRYRGLGCRQAVAHVNIELNNALAGQQFADQAALDQAMLTLDGTPNKARLGANAILAVSLAFARAVALERGVPLYQHFADILAGVSGARHAPLTTLPRTTINLFSGGKHAGGQVPIQDVLVVPAAATTMDDALSTTVAVFQTAAELMGHKYQMRTLTADEGGLAPPFANADAMLDDAVEAIESAGYTPGKEVVLAIDVASSHFYEGGRYYLDGLMLDSVGMVAKIEEWMAKYPIVSVEDGLAEDDWRYWPQLRQAIGGKALVLGDDLLCTNPTRIQRAIDEGAADALLLKVNQIGTLTEAAQACRLARGGGLAGHDQCPLWRNRG